MAALLPECHAGEHDRRLEFDRNAILAANISPSGRCDFADDIIASGQTIKGESSIGTSRRPPFVGVELAVVVRVDVNHSRRQKRLATAPLSIGISIIENKSRNPTQIGLPNLTFDREQQASTLPQHLPLKATDFPPGSPFKRRGRHSHQLSLKPLIADARH